VNELMASEDYLRSQSKSETDPRTIRGTTRGFGTSKAMRSLQVECPENLDLGLFTEQACYILSVQILVSVCPKKRHPRGTAGPAVSISPKKLARTLILMWSLVSRVRDAIRSKAAPAHPLSSPIFRQRRKVDEKESIRSRGGSETLDQSSRLLFMRTAGHGGCSPGRLTSDRDGDQWCRART